MALDHSCQVQRAPHSERGHDLYETPAVATQALLRVEKLPHYIWEPAAGRGAIVNVLRSAGHLVYATDLINHGIDAAQAGIQTGRDFFEERRDWCAEKAIVTNPPYKLANEFVLHALRLCPKVYMLLRLAFYESMRRTPILEHCGLKRIHVFRRRLPMMHRDGWEGRKANSGMAFAWFVWDQTGDLSEPTVIDRISWEQ